MILSKLRTPLRGPPVRRVGDYSLCVPTAYSVANWGEHEPDAGAWESVHFSLVDRPLPPATAALIAAFRDAIANALAATFHVAGLTPTLRRWLTENHGDQLPYASRLLDSPALARALPELRRVRFPAAGGLRDEPAFEWIHPLYLAPSLALQLSSEGAYDSGPRIASAKSVADACVDQLVGGRFEDFHVAGSNDAWSDWFYDVLPTWDHTWVITDLRHEQATILCVTDTD